jgi:hypothetical protein
VSRATRRSTWGSFENDKSRGTRVRFRNPTGEVGHSIAKRSVPLYNWSPVYYVDVC